MAQQTMILMGYFIIFNQLVISTHWWVISPSKVTKTWPHDATRRDPWKFCWTWRFHREKWWNMVDKNGRKWWKMVNNCGKWRLNTSKHEETGDFTIFHHISPRKWLISGGKWGFHYTMRKTSGMAQLLAFRGDPLGWCSLSSRPFLGVKDNPSACVSQKSSHVHLPWVKDVLNPTHLVKSPNVSRRKHGRASKGWHHFFDEFRLT